MARLRSEVSAMHKVGRVLFASAPTCSNSYSLTGIVQNVGETAVAMSTLVSFAIHALRSR